MLWLLELACAQIMIELSENEIAAASEGLSKRTHFFKRIYADGVQKYIDRLEAIGFLGKELLLGCGMRFWTMGGSNEFPNWFGCRYRRL